MIYIVCSCDIWKTTDSMRIITATTSVTKLKQLIAQLIEDDTFGYDVVQNRMVKMRQVIFVKITTTASLIWVS